MMGRCGRASRLWNAVSGAVALAAGSLPAFAQSKAPGDARGADKPAFAPVCTHQNAYGAVNGSCWSSQGHPNWNVVQTTLNYNPTEWQVYAAAAQGKAHCAAPGQSPVVVRESGSPFDVSWEGVAAFYLQQSSAEKPVYMVVKVLDQNALRLDRPCDSAGSQTFHFVTTTNAGAVNVDGTVVTWVSGQPFNVFARQKNAWRIDGVWRTCRNITLERAECDTSGESRNVRYFSYQNIFDQVVNWRLQKVLGVNEENLTCTARATGSYDCRPLASGKGTLWPWFLGNGFAGAPAFAPHRQISLNTDGTLSLGCARGCESLVVDAGAAHRASNFLRVSPGQDGPPTLAAASNQGQSDVGVTLASAGKGPVVLAVGGGAKPMLVLQPGEGDAGLAVTHGGAGVELSARGGAQDIDIALVPKGAGAIQIGAFEPDIRRCGALPGSTGCLRVKDARGVLRHLPLF